MLKPSQGREAYIFPDVLVSPLAENVKVNPSDDAENDLSAQKGLTIAAPVPADTNKSNSILGLQGESNPRLVISPSLPLQLIMRDATVIQRGRPTTPAFETQIFGEKSKPLVEITVPRFVVVNDRHPGEEQAFLRDFFRWPTFDADYLALPGNGAGYSIPGGRPGSSHWTGYGTASFMLSETDNDVLVFIVRKLSDSGNQDLDIALNGYSLQCFRYEIKNGKPYEPDPFQGGFAGHPKAFVFEASSPDFADSFGFSSPFVHPDCVAMRLRKDVFIATTDSRSTTGSPIQLVIHKYTPDPQEKFNGTIEAYTPKIFVSDIDANVNCGISGAAGDSNALIAFGANTDSVFSDGSSPGRQTILFAKTSDFANFSEKNDTQLDLVSLDSFRTVTTKSVLGLTDIKFTRETVDGSARTRHGWAINRFGQIFKTEDEGVTWKQQLEIKSVLDPTNAGNLDLRVPLRSMTIASDLITGAEILYIIGDNSTLLRSVDGGKKWIVLNTADKSLTDFAKEFDPPVEIPSEFPGQSFKSITAAYENTDFDNTGGTERKLIWIGGENILRIDLDGTVDASEIDEVKDVYIATQKIYKRFQGSTVPVLVTVVTVDDRNKERIIVNGPNCLKWIRAESNNNYLITCGSPNKNGSSLLSIKDVNGGASFEIYEAENYPFAPTEGKLNGLVKTDPLALDAPFYVVGDRGFVGRLDVSDFTTPVLTTRTFPTNDDLLDVGFAYNSGTSKISVFALGRTTLFRSNPAIFPSDAQNWIGQQLGGLVDGVGAVSGFNGQVTGEATALAVMDFDNIVIGAGGGVLMSNINTESRINPGLMYIGSGQYLLACANVSQGRIEFFRSIDNGQTFQKQENDGSAIKFDIPDEPHILTAEELNRIPKPVLVRQVNGDVWCLIGGRRLGPTLQSTKIGNVSHNDGRSWKTGDEASISIPIGTFQLDKPIPDGLGTIPGIDSTEGYITESFVRGLTAIALGDGRVFTAVPAYGITSNPAVFDQNQDDSTAPGVNILSGKHAIWACRDLELDQGFSETNDAREGLPAVPNTGVYMGLGGTRAVFSAPPRVNDVWSIEKDWLFPARHLVVESPSRFYATEDDEDAIQIVISRESPEYDELIGKGSHFNVSALALFGVNFREANIWIAHPEVSVLSGSGDVLNIADRTDFRLRSDVDAGQATIVDGTRIIDEGKNWIPNQFMPGTRTYYVMTLDNNHDPIDSNAPYVYKILSNTRNMLICDAGTINLSSNRLRGFDAGTPSSGIVTGLNLDYLIFSDRMYTLGDDGLHNDMPFGALLDTPYEYTRFIVINIPAQPTFERYRKIGTFVGGRHLPLEFQVSNKLEELRMRGRNGRWEQDAVVTEVTGVSGVDTIQHQSKPIQQWSLPYEQVPIWDQQLKTYGLGPKTRRAFAVVFDTADKQSIEWVRMTRGQQWSGSGVSRASQTVELREVI